jgi:hypothetical protein
MSATTNASEMTDFMMSFLERTTRGLQPSLMAFCIPMSK